MEKWQRYILDGSDFNFKRDIDEIINMVKNMDVNKVQEGITSLQKAVDLFSSLFIKGETSPQPTSSYTPRPIYRSFED